MVVMTEMPQDHKPAGLQRLRGPSWPSLGGDADPSPAGAAGGGDDWGEFQDTDGGSADGQRDAPQVPLKPNPKILHRCASTPDFGYDDEYSQSSESSAGPEAEGEKAGGEDAAADPTPAEASAGSARPGAARGANPAGGGAWGASAARGGGAVRRIPSFAEMVKANAASAAEEEAKRAAHREATAEKLRRQREARRKARARHMKLVVTPIKRCSKSTGDLQSLSRIHEADGHEEDVGGGGAGGGGGGFGGIAEHHEEEEVLGETDAMEFYHRKAKGAQNRVSGKMIRPDEAKRKEMSVNKREAQRQKQQAAQGAKGGGGKGGGTEKEKAASKGAKGKGGKKR